MNPWRGYDPLWESQIHTYISGGHSITYEYFKSYELHYEQSGKSLQPNQ